MAKTKQEVQEILKNGSETKDRILFLNSSELQIKDLFNYPELLENIDAVVVERQDRNYDMTLTPNSNFYLSQEWIQYSQQFREAVYQEALYAKKAVEDLVFDEDIVENADDITVTEIKALYDATWTMKHPEALCTVLDAGLSNRTRPDYTPEGTAVYSIPKTKEITRRLSGISYPGDIMKIRTDRDPVLTIKRPYPNEGSIESVVAEIVDSAKYAKELDLSKNNILRIDDIPVGDPEYPTYISTLSVSVDDNGHAHVLDLHNGTMSAFPITWATDERRQKELGIVGITINPNPYGEQKIVALELSSDDRKQYTAILEASQIYQTAAEYIRAACKEVVPENEPVIMRNKETALQYGVTLPIELITLDTQFMSSDLDRHIEIPVESHEYGRETLVDIRKPIDLRDNTESTIFEIRTSETLGNDFARDIKQSFSDTEPKFRFNDDGKVIAIKINTQDQVRIDDMINSIQKEANLSYLMERTGKTREELTYSNKEDYGIDLH